MRRFCEYRDVLGKVGEGVHSVRVANVAILDVAGTFALALLVSWGFGISYWIALALTFLLGILLHRLFCVPTTLDNLLFGKNVVSE